MNGSWRRKVRMTGKKSLEEKKKKKRQKVAYKAVRLRKGQATRTRKD
jgi:hypothetical protein